MRAWGLVVLRTSYFSRFHLTFMFTIELDKSMAKHEVFSSFLDLTNFFSQFVRPTSMNRLCGEA